MTEQNNNNRPIGVFDSGLGGLTVLGPLTESLPNESMVYLGDLARTPYGSRTTAEIRAFALEGIDFLLSQNVKALVIACNSASSVAMPDLFARTTVPIFDVISPGAKNAVRLSRSRTIGVVGTEATIQSNAYELELKSNDVNVSVHQKACPKLAPMIERGASRAGAYLSVVKDMLSSLPLKEIDALILGCTHYPLIKDVFIAACGDEVRIIDSGRATADYVAEELKERGLLKADDSPAERRFVVTTSATHPATDRFRISAERFLGQSIEQLETVDLGATSNAKP